MLPNTLPTTNYPRAHQEPAPLAPRNQPQTLHDYYSDLEPERHTPIPIPVTTLNQNGRPTTSRNPTSIPATNQNHYIPLPRTPGQLQHRTYDIHYVPPRLEPMHTSTSNGNEKDTIKNWKLWKQRWQNYTIITKLDKEEPDFQSALFLTQLDLKHWRFVTGLN